MREQIVSLNGDWGFAFLASGDIQSVSLPKADEFVFVMPIPGYWDDQTTKLRASEIWRQLKFQAAPPSPLRWPSALNPGDISIPYILGIGCYRKLFKTTFNAAYNQHILQFGPVMQDVSIWVNRELVGCHYGHSTAFEIPLHNLKNVGEVNELIIVVCNLRDDRSGSSMRGYSGRSAGIRNGISLCVHDQIRLSDVHIRPNRFNNKSITMDIECSGDFNKSQSYQYRYQLKNDNNETIKSGEHPIIQKSFAIEFNADGLKTWSDREPNLYYFTAEILCNQEVISQKSIKWGYRTITVNKNKIIINGLSVFLRGTCEHHYYPLTCMAPSDKASYIKNLIALKEIGINWLRFHTWVPPIEYLEAADELGLFVQIEPPVRSTDEEWCEIIRFCRNHPSVIIYCVGNEGILDESKIELAKRWQNLLRDLSEDVLFSPQEAMRGVEYGDLGQDVALQPMPHNPKRLALLNEFSDIFEPYCNEFSHTTIRGQWRDLANRLSIYEKPLLIHELGIYGGYLDITLEARYQETRIGTDLFTATRIHLEENGLLSKAGIYYKNSCALAKLLRKYAIENARKCSGVKGYDYLGATDAHWHRTGYECGILNEFYELKVGESKEEVLRYNGESVLLIDLDTQRNFFSGSTFNCQIFLSHFGKDDIEKGELICTVEGSQAIFYRKSIQILGIQQGSLNTIAPLQFILPNIQAPEKLRIKVRLNSLNCQIENDWSIWVYPQLNQISENKTLTVVSQLTEDDIKKINEGERVLLLGNAPFTSMETWFMSSSSGRAGGHKGSVIYDHPLMRLMPNDGFMDFQFFNMIDCDALPVYFEKDYEIPFYPIIELISPYKRIRKMSVLFEFTIGKGKLVVCTLNLKSVDAGTIYFKKILHDYVVSNECKPITKIDVSVIQTLLNKNSIKEQQFKTDQGLDPSAMQI